MNSAVIDPIFGDSLACLELRRLSIDVCPLDQLHLAEATQRSVSLLQTLAVLDNHDERDESDAPHALRLERKTDLLLSMVAGLVRAGQPQQAPAKIQWSASGAIIAAIEMPPVGSTGLLHLQPSDLLPSFISLPFTTHESPNHAETGEFRVSFEPLSDLLRSELEGHLFRVNRRAVAELKRQVAS